LKKWKPILYAEEEEEERE